MGKYAIKGTFKYHEAKIVYVNTLCLIESFQISTKDQCYAIGLAQGQ